MRWRAREVGARAWEMADAGRRRLGKDSERINMKSLLDGNFKGFCKILPIQNLLQSFDIEKFWP